MGFIIVIGVLIVIIYVFKQMPRDDQNTINKEVGKLDITGHPFKMAFSILTNAEKSFYNVLINIIDRENYIICPKVRILDILWTSDYAKNKTTFLNKVNRKHLDFVVCEAKSLKPVYAIELDDRSHLEEERQQRDAFIDALFKELSFRIIHIPVQKEYNIENLKKIIYNLGNETFNINKFWDKKNYI
jgi:hypothetical protein